MHAKNLRKILEIHCHDFENYNEKELKSQLNILYAIIDLLEVINNAFIFFTEKFL